MLSNIFLSDCTKVLRGLSLVTSAAVSAQATECATFVRLLGVNNLIASANARTITNVDLKKNLEFATDRAYVLGKQVDILAKEVCAKGSSSSTAACFGVPSRSFSSSTKEAAHGSHKRRSLKLSKQRHVPATRLGRAAGFGSKYPSYGDNVPFRSVCGAWFGCGCRDREALCWSLIWLRHYQSIFDRRKHRADRRHPLSNARRSPQARTNAQHPRYKTLALSEFRPKKLL